jgi:ribosomal protein S18 acetylase RimI-like enzyme
MRDVDAFVADASDHDLDDVQGSYLDPGGEFLVGEIDDEIVAMGALRPATDYLAAFLEDLPERTATVKRMRVDPAHQRRGYGQALYDELEARARDVDAFVLDTTPGQTAARRFYETNGFREARRVDTEFGGEPIELCLYRKTLD